MAAAPIQGAQAAATHRNWAVPLADHLCKMRCHTAPTPMGISPQRAAKGCLMAGHLPFRLPCRALRPAMAHVREGMVPEDLRGKAATTGGFCTSLNGRACFVSLKPEKQTYRCCVTFCSHQGLWSSALQLDMQKILMLDLTLSQCVVCRMWCIPAAALHWQTATNDSNKSFTIACCMVLCCVKDVWLITLRYGPFDCVAAIFEATFVQQ